MLLRPCDSCRRHVAADEDACPFCGVALPPSPVRTARVTGRLSRAAVFVAGATLGGTACWTDAQPRSTPIDHHPVDQRTETGPIEPKPGEIRGVVRDGATGAPLPGYSVILRTPDGNISYATSNARGEYVFANLTPGQYFVSYQSNNPRQQAIGMPVELSVDAGQRVDVPVTFEAPDPGPCCKPYGAPPARRRIV